MVIIENKLVYTQTVGFKASKILINAILYILSRFYICG